MTQLLWTPTPEPLRAWIYSAGVYPFIVLGWSATDCVILGDLGRPAPAEMYGELIWVGPPGLSPSEDAINRATRIWESRGKQ